MKPVLTADEYNRVDKAFTGDLIQAMDRAGYAVHLAAVRAGAGYGRKVAVLAGPGNNGGDGYVAARYLHARGCDVLVNAFGKPRTDEAKDAAAKATSAGVKVQALGPPYPADLIVDSLFGGGIRGQLPDEILAWMRVGRPVVAVDYPTGLDPNTGIVGESAFVASETVTFQTLKTGHVRGSGPEHCGNVTVVDIGISGGEPSILIAEEVDAERPARRRTDHKWSAGSVLVAGGSTGITGASVFAGMAALAFGAGAVVVASPERELVSQLAPQLPTLEIADAIAHLDRFDVVVAGPGLGATDVATILPLLENAGSVVLDAGGLLPQAVSAAKSRGGEVVITPHSAEFERLTEAASGAFSARAYARQIEGTVLLKGNPTLVTDGDIPVLVRTGGPELASIGTGDVLAGMIGALWARGLKPMAAAVSGAYWHGVAGASLARTGTVTAPDLADHIRGFAW